MNATLRVRVCIGMSAREIQYFVILAFISRLIFDIYIIDWDYQCFWWSDVPSSYIELRTRVFCAFFHFILILVSFSHLIYEFYVISVVRFAHVIGDRARAHKSFHILSFLFTVCNNRIEIENPQLSHAIQINRTGKLYFCGETTRRIAAAENKNKKKETYGRQQLMAKATTRTSIIIC